MSAFSNMMTGFGSLANSAGVTGDGPGGLNAMQRAGMTADQNIAYSMRTAMQQLAQSPEFMKATPAEQSRMVASVTGSQDALQQAAQQAQVQGIDLSNPGGALKKLQAYMSPDQLKGILTDPMALSMLNMGGIGGGGASGAPGASASPGAVSAPAASAPEGSSTPNANKTQTPEQYVKTHVPPFYQNQVMDILQGGELPKDIAPKDRNILMNWAHNADPEFSEISAQQRATMVKNATSGDMYKLAASINTAMGHLYDLHQLAPGLKQGKNSLPALNWAENHLIDLQPGGSPETSRYESSLTTAAPEIAKYLGGGAATDTGTEEAQSSYSAKLPAATIQQNALDLGAKMMTKGGSLQHEYNTALGPMAGTLAGKKDIVSPMSEALYADMQGQPLTLQQQKLVNQHRAEANLPMKKWGAKMTASKPVKFGDAGSAPPSPEEARAILRYRGRI